MQIPKGEHYSHLLYVYLDGLYEQLMLLNVDSQSQTQVTIPDGFKHFPRRYHCPITFCLHQWLTIYLKYLLVLWPTE